MTKNNIIIIGCGAGGGTAAQFARKTDRKASITIFEQTSFPQYSKCGLPYTISGDIPEIMDLIEFSKEWFEKARIDLHLNTTVDHIDSEKNILYVSNENNTKQEYEFETIILATGASPFIPPIKNIQKNGVFPNGVFSLRTINDAQNISKQVKKGKHALVIGAGFIGLEIAECLHKMGMNVTIIEAMQTILPQLLDSDLSNQIQKHLEQYITIKLHHFVKDIQVTNNQVTHVYVEHAETHEKLTLPADLIILATGTRPNIRLAKELKCTIGSSGGIVVNNKSETSQKNVYAVGDCTEFIDFITKKPVPIGLGSIAVRQAIAAGVNAAGGQYELQNGVLQTCTSEFFGLEIASVGPSISQLEELKPIVGKHTGSSRPEYFPGGKSITCKTYIDSSTGSILGARAIGTNAAQRINTYATALLANMNIETFRTLRTAYAPPIAPTLDTVTIAADIAATKWQRKRSG